MMPKEDIGWDFRGLGWGESFCTYGIMHIVDQNNISFLTWSLVFYSPKVTTILVLLRSNINKPPEKLTEGVR